MVEAIDGKMSFPLPTLIECNIIPNNREEIPTPEVAQHHHHLRSIASDIPPLDANADILLPIGRNLLRAHKVRKHRNGSPKKLDLVWVIIGDVCLGSVHKPTDASALKTHVLDNGHTSLLNPCDRCINVRENFDLRSYTKATIHFLGKTVFRRTSTDHQLAPSVKDVMFMKEMEGIFKDKANSWVASLPFRSPRLLPDKRVYTENA